MIRDSEGRHFTLAEDFDRVAAERDELQRQLDHKDQQRESELRNGQAGDRLVRELQQRLTAADQEIDDLRAELTTNPKPDSLLCRFYEVTDWPGLVRELVGHIAQLQDSAKRNVKPWEDTFPPTLLLAYIKRVNAENSEVLGQPAYRLLGDGDVIKDGDETLNDDTATWGKVPMGVFIGMPYNRRVMLPVRRAET
jgi:hypothetical protein